MPVSRRGLLDHASGRIIRAAANANARAAAKVGSEAASRQMTALLKRAGAAEVRPLILTHDLYERAKGEGYDLSDYATSQRIMVI